MMYTQEKKFPPIMRSSFGDVKSVTTLVPQLTSRRKLYDSTGREKSPLAFHEPKVPAGLAAEAVCGQRIAKLGRRTDHSNNHRNGSHTSA
jgi:hypothetical protein